MIDINWGLMKNDLKRRIYRDLENYVTKTGPTLRCRAPWAMFTEPTLFIVFVTLDWTPGQGNLLFYLSALLIFNIY